MKYKVTAVFNGQTFKKNTDDVSATIDELKPDQLHTQMFLTVSGKNILAERILSLVQGKKLFANPEFKEIFINNLLLNYDRV